MRDSREDPESLEREQLDLRKRLLTPEERDTIINTSRLELISDAERKRIVLASMPDFEREEITPESEIREVKPIRPKIIDSKSKLDCVILHNSELKLRKGYDSQYERAVEYFDRGMNGYPPILVRETEDTLIRFVYEEVHGGPPKVVIESMDDVDNLLEKKPEEKETKEKCRGCLSHINHSFIFLW